MSDRDREVIDVDADIVCTGRHFARPDPQRPLNDGSYRRTELQRVTQSELGSRSALGDDHRKKRAMNIAADVVNSHKRKEIEVIEISSDSEPETCPFKRQRLDHVASSAGPAHLPKLEPKLEPRFSPALRSPSPHQCQSDADDCIDFLAALDISNDANWAPLPERNKAENSAQIHDPDTSLSKAQPVPPFRCPRKKPPTDYCRIPFDWTSVSTWGMMSRNYGITTFPKPFPHACRQERLFPRRPPNLHYEKGYTKLDLTAKYPHLTSGSVNKIIQGQGIVVICSVVEGGLEESDDEDAEHRPPPPENRLGSLVVYHHGRVYMEPAHCHSRKTSRGSVMKYYSVNDVAFNPLNPRQFLSSGHDLVVQMWEIFGYDGNDGHLSLGTIRDLSFDSRPQDLVYSPDGLLLAVTCFDGTVWLYSQDLFENMLDVNTPAKKLNVAPKGAGHAAGSALWGKGPSKNLLFSSSEPKRKEDYSGFHFAFDTCKGARAIQFDAAEAGDAAAISPDGTTLVLFTTDKDNTHPVRLYDVRRKRNDAYETEELEKFQIRPVGSDEELDVLGEVNQASFSPDGRLLAVARNDNALHVYDVRAISRGPLCRFEHDDSDAVGGGGFGIVAADWIQGRERIGIVSGGNDGCVRLWEPALASTDKAQGALIGRTDFDVGHFSIGNPQNRELPLVIGDSGGGVQTYDFTNADGIRI